MEEAGEDPKTVERISRMNVVTMRLGINIDYIPSS